GLRGERVLFGDHEMLWQGRRQPYWVSLQPDGSAAEEEGYENLHIGDRPRFGFLWQDGRLKLYESYEDQGVIRYKDSPIQILRPVGSAPEKHIPLTELEPIVDPESCFASFRDGLLRVRWLGREAFVDHHGRLVIPPRMAFDEINDFVEGMAIFTPDDGGHFGFIDKTGRVAIPAIFKTLGAFSEGLAIAGVVSDQTYAFCEAGTCKPRWISAAEAESLKDRYGYIDIRGQFQIPPRFDHQHRANFHQGRAVIERDGVWHQGVWHPGIRVVIDRQGREIPLPDGAHPHSDFSEGYLSYVEKNHFGYLDRNGKPVLQAALGGAQAYTSAGDFAGGLARVKTADWAGFINAQGQRVLNLPIGTLDSDTRFDDGRLWVADARKKVGFIDHTGTLVIPHQFEYHNGTSGFREGRAMVSRGGKYGYIDINGTEVVPITHDCAAFGFSEGIAWIADNHRVRYIDHNGKDVFTTIEIPEIFQTPADPAALACTEPLLPLAQALCSRPEGVAIQQQLVLAWQDTLDILEEGDREALWAEQRSWLAEAETRCGLPDRGKNDITANPASVGPCVGDVFAARIQALIERQNKALRNYSPLSRVPTTSGLFEAYARNDESTYILARLNGHTYAISDDPDRRYSLRAHYPEQPPYRYLLLTVGGYSTICLGRTALFDAMPGSLQSVGELPGCLGHPRLELANDGLHIIFSAADPVEEEIWRYPDGRLERIKEALPPLAIWLIHGKPVTPDGRQAELTVLDKQGDFPPDGFAARFEIRQVESNEVWRVERQSTRYEARVTFPDEFATPFKAGRYQYQVKVLDRIVDKGEFTLGEPSHEDDTHP
ncbi:MAG: WG repeat-containing protein, partial [Pseudomonadota bacterium]